MEKPYFICENAPEFNRADPNDSTIAFGEVDIYARDPRHQFDHLKEHRLSIRRQFADGKPGEWELYRSYVGPRAAGARRDPYLDEVVVHGTLAEVCQRGNEEWLRAWGWLSQRRAEDVPCPHLPGNRSLRCGAVTREDMIGSSA
jgi:hypothetical protein